MSFAGTNSLAIILGAVASFLFGGVWYGIFSKSWMEAAGLKLEDLKPADGAAAFAPYAIAFVAQLVMATVLAGVIGHLGQGQVTLKNGIISAFLIWLGFVATTITVNHTFQMQPRALTLIDAGHWLGVLLIQGALIGWMGVSSQ
jgi:hypothetical protein